MPDPTPAAFLPLETHEGIAPVAISGESDSAHLAMAALWRRGLWKLRSV